MGTMFALRATTALRGRLHLKEAQGSEMVRFIPPSQSVFRHYQSPPVTALPKGVQCSSAWQQLLRAHPGRSPEGVCVPKCPSAAECHSEGGPKAAPQ